MPIISWFYKRIRFDLFNDFYFITQNETADDDMYICVEFSSKLSKIWMLNEQKCFYYSADNTERYNCTTVQVG